MLQENCPSDESDISEYQKVEMNMFLQTHKGIAQEWSMINEEKMKIKMNGLGFPGGAVVENLPANAGDTGSSPGLERSHMPRSN